VIQLFNLPIPRVGPFRAWHKAGFSCFGSGVQCLFFPISWWNQDGEHPYADFNLTGDIISRTPKTVISRHKYGNTFPSKHVICHAFYAIVFQERAFETKYSKKSVSPFGDVGPPKYQWWGPQCKMSKWLWRGMGMPQPRPLVVVLLYYPTPSALPR
jgi:hypothetical protein